MLFQVRQFLPVQKQLDGSALAGSAADKSSFIQHRNHPMGCGGGDLKITRYIQFRRRLPVEFGVIINEGQALALF